MVEQFSRFHTTPHAGPPRTSQIIGGPTSATYDVLGDDESGIPSSIKPVKYRYVLADAHSGQVVAVLPMSGVTYGVGIYRGTQMSGSVYVPGIYLNEMPHAPLDDYERWRHPDHGLPIGPFFEVGNKAIYVMRNDEVVWGGILWTRSYSSGGSNLEITAQSWDSYIYYRTLRKSVVFPAGSDKYTVWRAVLMQTLNDFTWGGNGSVGRDSGNATDGDIIWTGKVLNGVSNDKLKLWEEVWPLNSAPIEIPDANVVYRSGINPATFTTKPEAPAEWRGYAMESVGDVLQKFADVNNLVTSGGFEYRVVCWYDIGDDYDPDPKKRRPPRFRQAYAFGEMEYGFRANGHPSQGATGIINPLFGRSWDRRMEIILDFPGHISEWSLTEGMEECATRVIVVNDLTDAAKIAAYDSHVDMLRPYWEGDGSNGWLLYDKVISAKTNSSQELTSIADVMLEKMRPPMAASIDDIGGMNTMRQRTSVRGTDLSITLYQDPTTTFPEWHLGDWVTFMISDPFYGGTMALQRRIIGYNVTIVGDAESDYSHEQISLELTDNTKVEAG